MSVVSPPESAPPTPPEEAAAPSTASTYTARAASKSPAAPPPTPAYITQPTERGAQSRRNGGVVAGLILIALGIVVLFGTWFPAGGAWLFLGLAAAFALARVLTGHPGYAVPAGVLLGFGAFIWLTETGTLSPAGSGGMFFVMLGLGFLAAYAIGARPQAAWPVVPALLLIGFGAFVQATTFGFSFGQFWWLAQYWPLSLVALGAWFLLRDRLPGEMRAPVAIVGAAALIFIGLLVAAAGVSTVPTPYARGPMPMSWPMFQVPFGNPPLQDTVNLSAATTSTNSIRLVNTSGSTVVRATSGSDVRVQATRHYWNANQAPDVNLVAANGVLDVQSSAVPGTYIDYVIDMPAALGADVRSASGSIDLSGLGGPVRLETASGGIDARDLGGSASITTASGGIRISNVAGDLRVSSTSGGVYGSGIKRIVDAHSTSGAIELIGDFATDAQVASTSGSVLLRFTPAAAVHVDATSLSGDVNATGLGLVGQTTGPHSLSGTLANGGPTLSVHTTSGSIQLLRAG